MVLSRLGIHVTPVFGVCVSFLIAIFLLGGGARADIVSLIILRPLAVLAVVYALLKLPRERISANRGLLIYSGVLVLYVLAQLVPLPPSIWQSLPGRDIVAEVDRVAGIAPQWRPFTLSIPGGWNAFYSLFVPLGVLLLGIQLAREERFTLLHVVLGFGAATAAVGLLQLLGPSGSSLYFYRITNSGQEVGLFSNRNHQAVFLACLLPMLAVFASLPAKTAAQTKLRLFLSLLFGICLLPLIVGTTSRAGLVAAAMGMLSVPFLFTLPRDLQPSGKKAKGWVKFVIVHGKLVRRSVALVLTLLAAGAVLISRNPAFERLAESNQDESRALIWSATTDLLDDYLPVGSGIGSFVEVFKVGEPLELVTETYVNHVHNDYLELLLTGGVLAALLLAIAAIWFAVRALNAWWGKRAQSRERSFARMASVVIAIMAVASAVDYPLRTPSLAAIFVISVLWLCGDRIEDGRQKGFA